MNECDTSSCSTFVMFSWIIIPVLANLHSRKESHFCFSLAHMEGNVINLQRSEAWWSSQKQKTWWNSLNLGKERHGHPEQQQINRQTDEQQHRCDETNTSMAASKGGSKQLGAWDIPSRVKGGSAFCMRQYIFFATFMQPYTRLHTREQHQYAVARSYTRSGMSVLWKEVASN